MPVVDDDFVPDDPEVDDFAPVDELEDLAPVLDVPLDFELEELEELVPEDEPLLVDEVPLPVEELVPLVDDVPFDDVPFDVLDDVELLAVVGGVGLAAPPTALAVCFDCWLCCHLRL